MLFRLTFLVFVFSIILTTATKADDSNSNVVVITVPSITTAATDNSNLNKNPNIIVITVPLPATAKANNSNLSPNTVATSLAVTKNELKKLNLKSVVRPKSPSLAIYNAYLKLEQRKNKQKNNATKKCKIPSKRIKGQ